jgi:site-specific recombinase XerC
LDERYRLMAEVQYGGGLRLDELARLRLKDVDLERRQITIRQGKGDLDRVLCGQRRWWRRGDCMRRIAKRDTLEWRFLGRWGR